MNFAHEYHCPYHFSNDMNSTCRLTTTSCLKRVFFALNATISAVINKITRPRVVMPKIAQQMCRRPTRVQIPPPLRVRTSSPPLHRGRTPPLPPRCRAPRAEQAATAPSAPERVPAAPLASRRAVANLPLPGLLSSDHLGNIFPPLPPCVKSDLARSCPWGLDLILSQP